MRGNKESLSQEKGGEGKAASSLVVTATSSLARKDCMAMDDFVNSCNAAATYPKNLISPGEYQHSLQSYRDQLDEREKQLFDVETKATLDFWELDDGTASTCSQSNGERSPAN
jgi:hypothetical protein